MSDKIRFFNNKWIWLFILLTFIPIVAISQISGKIKIAVIDLETSSNLAGRIGGNIAELMRGHLGHVAKFEVMEKKEMDDILNIQGFLRPSGCRSSECHSASFDSRGTLHFLQKCGMPDIEAAIELGNILMVDKVLIGLVNKLEDRYTISVKVIDIATGQVEATDQISCHHEIHTLEQRIDELAARLARGIPGQMGEDEEGRENAVLPNMGGMQKGQRIDISDCGEIKDMKAFMEVIQKKMKGETAFNESDGGETAISQKTVTEETGMKNLNGMVLIPEGKFKMGSDSHEEDGPVHEVYLDAFYIDRFEVTNAQYMIFLKATGNRPPTTWGRPGFDLPDQPVTGISWEAANDYAVWSGKRLPTEAEWEKAARGMDGRKFPWGNEWSEGKCRAGGKDSSAGPFPVGSCPEGASPYGCHDMAGNVWEWCSDWFSTDYYGKSEYRNPEGPQDGSWHVLRGGGWDSLPDEVRSTFRRGGCPDGGYVCAGFRCVKDVKDRKEIQ
ncbi:formylglycine-generating enzyme family protein [bacterium]|nr:formylglycine-generating enzyme family protein [bacterium]